MASPLDHDGVVDAARLGAEAACGEELVATVVGADAAEPYVGLVETALHEQLAVEKGEVEVPLLATLGGAVEVEVGGSKLLIHLVAHLEGIEGDAGAYDRHKVGGVGAIGGTHVDRRFMGYAGEGAAPSGMDGTHGAVLGVVEKNGYAVGGGHAHTHARDVGHHGIDALKNHLAHVVGKGAKLVADDARVNTVGLVGQDEVAAVDAQLLAEQLAVGCHMGRVVAAEGVDVERGIRGACAHAAVTGGAEGDDAVAHVVGLEL